MIGNVGADIWSHFRADERDVTDPLDDWTRRMLRPIAERFGAGYVHPSDRPYIPMQRWAQRADDVFPSPIGLLVHPVHGLWHAYRGAFLTDKGKNIADAARERHAVVEAFLIALGVVLYTVDLRDRASAMKKGTVPFSHRDHG